MGACCRKAQGLDLRYERMRCPYYTLSHSNITLPLPIKIGEPPSIETSSTIPNSQVEEHNAKLRVGYKILNDLSEAVNSVMMGYKSEGRMIQEFKRNQFNKSVTEDLFHNLTNKVKNFHYVQVLSEKFADFLLFDCTQDIILKAHRTLDFDFWRSKDLINIITKILSLAIDFSITRHRYARSILEDLNFYKQYLDSSTVTPPEVYNQFDFQGHDLLLSRIVEEEDQPDPRDRRSSDGVERQTYFYNVILSLCSFFQSADPILSTIANKLKNIEREEEETNPAKVERAGALIEGIMWLLKQTIDKYKFKYNAEIASIVKAGVACGNILLRAEMVSGDHHKFERVSERERSKAAILEKWKFYLQNTIDSTTMSLLPVNKMKPNKDVEIYVMGGVLKDADRQPVGSPFLDLSQELLRSVPSYSQAEIADPYRFQDRLTVKLKTLPKMPLSFRTARRGSGELGELGESTTGFKSKASSVSLDERSHGDEWQFLRFPQDMGLRDYKFLLMFLALRFNEFCFQ